MSGFALKVNRAWPIMCTSFFRKQPKVSWNPLTLHSTRYIAQGNFSSQKSFNGISYGPNIQESRMDTGASDPNTLLNGPIKDGLILKTIQNRTDHGTGDSNRFGNRTIL